MSTSLYIAFSLYKGPGTEIPLYMVSRIWKIYGFFSSALGLGEIPSLPLLSELPSDLENIPSNPPV